MSRKLLASCLEVFVLFLLLNFVGFGKNAEAADIPIYDPRHIFSFKPII